VFDERFEELEVGLHRGGGAGQADGPSGNVRPEASDERRDEGLYDLARAAVPAAQA